MANMPLRPTRHDDLALDRRLAALAPRAEELVVVQMAVEPQPFIPVILLRSALHVLDIFAIPAPHDAVDALLALAIGLRVERHALERLTAVVAAEALGMEACAGGADDAAGDGQGAGLAECRGLCGAGGRPVALRERRWCSVDLARQGAALGCRSGIRERPCRVGRRSVDGGKGPR